MQTFSHSRIGTFKQCPKKYEYNYINKLEPIGTKDALNIGKSVHHGIEKGSSQAALDYMEEQNFFIDEKAETNKAMVLAMVDVYLEKWGTEKKKHEVEFRLPIMAEIELLGYIDSIIEETEGYWIEEIKTASIVNADYIDKLEYASQPTKYLMAANNLKEKLGLDPNKPILGIKYRVLRKPMIRQKMNETIDQFRQRLIEKYTEEKDDYVFEFTLTRSDEDIQDCLEDIKQDTWNIIHTERFTKNESACSMYGRCPYMELCMKMDGAIMLYKEKEEREEQNVTEE